jgi:hypothetical protein
MEMALRVLLPIVGLALFLAGCQSGPRAPGGETFMSDASISAKDDEECRSFGAAPGSQAYFDCRMALNQNRQQAANNQQRYQAQNFRTGAMLMRGY